MRMLLIDTGEIIEIGVDSSVYVLPEHVKKWPNSAVPCKIVQVL